MFCWQFLGISRWQASARCQFNRTCFPVPLQTVFVKFATNMVVAVYGDCREPFAFCRMLSRESNALIGAACLPGFVVEELCSLEITISLSNISAVVEGKCAARINRECIGKVLSCRKPIVLICRGDSSNREHDGMDLCGVHLLDPSFQSLGALCCHVADRSSSPRAVNRNDDRLRGLQIGWCAIIFQIIVVVSDGFISHT